MVLVPLLSLVFRVDLRYAIGTSLVSVIATSCGAAAAYVKEGYTNLRIGMFPEIATTLGAWAALDGRLGADRRRGHPVRHRAALAAWFSHHEPRPDGQAAHRTRGPNASAWTAVTPRLTARRRIKVRGVPGGLALMALAGVLSGRLGIGSGR